MWTAPPAERQVSLAMPQEPSYGFLPCCFSAKKWRWDDSTYVSWWRPVYAAAAPRDAATGGGRARRRGGLAGNRAA